MVIASGENYFEDVVDEARAAVHAEGWVFEEDVMTLCQNCTEIHDAAIEAWVLPPGEDDGLAGWEVNDDEDEDATV